jgi:RNase P/RNase MRP subunit p30
MVENKKFNLIKVQNLDNKDVYINKKYITRVHENTVGVIEIQLLNETSIFTNEKNINLLVDRLSI